MFESSWRRIPGSLQLNGNGDVGGQTCFEIALQRIVAYLVVGGLRRKIQRQITSAELREIFASIPWTTNKQWRLRLGGQLVASEHRRMTVSLREVRDRISLYILRPIFRHIVSVNFTPSCRRC
jgi:hypothetical protein